MDVVSSSACTDPRRFRRTQLGTTVATMRDPIKSSHVGLLGRYLTFDPAEQSAVASDLADNAAVWSDIFAATLPLGLVS